MNPPRFTLRIKLAFLSLLLLAIPLVGFRHVSMMHSLLIETQEQALSLTARALATIIDDRPELFGETTPKTESAGKTVDAFLLQKSIRLDGNTDDWGGLLREAADFGRRNILEENVEYDPRSFSFRHLSGRHENYLYLLFIVKDDRVVHRARYASRLDRCDHLQIALENEGGLLDFYVVATGQSGPVNASLVLGGPDDYRSTAEETRIQGTWKDTEDGYILEMRMPLAMITDRISFAVADVDDPGSRQLKTVIGTGGVRKPEELGILLAKSPTLERILNALKRPTSKIWVVDRQRRVRALVGRFETGEETVFSDDLDRPGSRLSRLTQRFESFFIRDGDEASWSVQPAASEFNLNRLRKVLAGTAIINRRPAGQSGRQIISAAEPLRVRGEVRGAVVVEQPTDAILAARSRMIEQIILVTFAVCLIGIVVLLLIASRLAGRIRGLRSQSDHAIGSDGRILQPFTPSQSKDELGDLSRHLAAMINRLHEFHQHQEKMADHLEHELRTPLAGVSASLTNLGRLLDSDNQAVAEYLLDARRNMQRLEGILTSIREAATIKEALRQDEQEKFDLGTALRTWVETSYRKTFSKVHFSLQTPTEPTLILADPNRIYQMMDKLVENAVDFSPAALATVVIRLVNDGENAHIEVINEGPLLDAGRTEQLFHSMVSLRPSRTAEKTHMGLGLFIVRSIAEFHGGKVYAANRTDGVGGAVFSVRLPLHSWVKNISIRR